MFRAANHQSASANQYVTIYIPREKPAERPSCFPHKLWHSNCGARLVDSRQTVQNKQRCTFTDQERDQLLSQEANYIHLNAEIRPPPKKKKLSCILPVSTLLHWWSDRRLVSKAVLGLRSVPHMLLMLRFCRVIKYGSVSHVDTVRRQGGRGWGRGVGGITARRTV